MSALAIKFFFRDWRSGELTLLLSSLIVAVAIVTGIALFTDRIQLAIADESSSFLAADSDLKSPREVPEKWLSRAENDGIRLAKVYNFSTMVSKGESLYLGSVKAVDGRYPLKGHLEVVDKVAGVSDVGQEALQSLVVDSGPVPGEIWVDARLISMLDIQMGDLLYVGATQLKVSQQILHEPDRGSTFFDFGPRVMMNIADVGATKVIQPGSRIEYRYLFSASAKTLGNYLKWLKPQLEPSHKIVDLKDGQPAVANAMAKAETFLLLAASLGVLLAGISVALSAQRYSFRHYEYVAVMKTLGAKSRVIFGIYGFNLLMVLVLSIVLGWLCGWFVQEVIFYSLNDLISLVVPASSFRPFVIGAVTAIVCVTCFALPSIISLKSVSPLRVFRKDIEASRAVGVATYISGFFGLLGLMLWYSQNLRLTVAVVVGCGLVFVTISLVAIVGLKMSRRLGMRAGNIWRLALANLQRRMSSNALQIVIFSVAFMLLMILTLVRTSLIDEWRMQMPAGTPNYFFINIAQDEFTEVEGHLGDNGVTTEGLFPMVRARFTELNGQDAVQLFAGQNIRALQRELNLSSSDVLPKDNKIIAGQWWDGKDFTESGYPKISVEQEFAEKMNLKLGDQLKFQIAAEDFTAEISSIRSLRWDGMRPNFYLLFPPSVIASLPATYITSFYLPDEKKQLINHIAKRFPTVTIIELGPIIKRVDGIIDRVSMAVEFVLVLILVSGLLVLVASIQASMDVRYHENAILRTLGAGKRLILGSLLIEFALMGSLSGLLGALGAEVTAYFVQTQVFLVEYVPHIWVWFVGPVFGAILISLVGVGYSRRVTSVSPLVVLRSIT